jgi:hypothetical protein
VNLNTIVDGRVWDGGILHRELQRILNSDDSRAEWDPWDLKGQVDGANDYNPYSGHLGPLFVAADFDKDFNPVFNPDIVASRRGYAGDLTLNTSVRADTTDSMLLLDGSVPTFFANPFRSAAAGDLVPLRNMLRPGTECTTLRRQMFSPGLDGEWDTNDDVILDTPLFASTLVGPGNEYHDANRNAYFRYQPITRLENLTTTRSNVYAVWITIGFFEVEEGQPFAGNPEGYRLGREMGSDTGEFTRLREFAIIDRTIPVAFEPGQNHNVERAIRLRRRIE